MKKILLISLLFSISNLSYALEEDQFLYKIRLTGLENKINQSNPTLPPINFTPNPEDADNDGVPDTEDPDHPSTEEDNYVSWLNFLNAFCGVSVADNTEVYNQLSTGSIYCEGFSKMPTEELPEININQLQLSGNSLWQEISGMSNVNNIYSLRVSPNNTDLNISNLSGKNYNHFLAWNIKGQLNINVNSLLWLFDSSLSNVTVNDLTHFRSNINIWNTYIDTLNINNTNILWFLDSSFGSNIRSMTASNDIERASWTTTKNNIDEFSGIKTQDIQIQNNILTNLNGLISTFSQPIVLSVSIMENQITDFSALRNLRIIERDLLINANSFDAKVLENLQVVNNLWINTNNITQKADANSSLCQGILNGNIKTYDSYSKYCN